MECELESGLNKVEMKHDIWRKHTKNEKNLCAPSILCTMSDDVSP